MKSSIAHHRPTTLAQAENGRTYRVVGVDGGCHVRTRLAGMGILPGQTVKVLKANPAGPTMIIVRTGKLALGRGISRRLLLTPDHPDPQ